jgi:putative two-component system response regulator
MKNDMALQAAPAAVAAHAAHGEVRPLVLVADDDEVVRTLLQMQMELDGYRVALAASGTEALRQAEAQTPDAILLDALMPDMDGFRVAEMLKSAERTRPVPIIMVTGMDDKASRLRGLRAGAQEFLAKPIDRTEVSLRVRNMLRLREYSNFLSSQNRVLGLMVEERSHEVLASYRETIETLSRAAAYKDEASGTHVRRISHYAEELARAMGMNAAFCETIHYASQMHDIGKIAIPDSILLKVGPLTHDEWEVMKTHTTLGARLLGRGDSPYLQMGAEIALGHHERWDGGGYPSGLKGQVIPISARIMNICDQYDALTSERPYKKALSPEAAFEVLSRGDGRTRPSHFDPDILEAFRRCEARFREVCRSIVD